MKLTKEQLKRIIKEELGKVMEKGAEIQEHLREIAYWMEENFIYNPEKGVQAWLQHNKVSPEIAQALIDMSEDIYNYMD